MDDWFDELQDGLESIVMTDENGDSVDFMIIDAAEIDGGKYILVVESELVEDDESEAIILKEIASDEDEVTYEMVSDEDEFDKVARHFQDSGETYDIDVD